MDDFDVGNAIDGAERVQANAGINGQRQATMVWEDLLGLKRNLGPPIVQDANEDRSSTWTSKGGLAVSALACPASKHRLMHSGCVFRHPDHTYLTGAWLVSSDAHKVELSTTHESSLWRMSVLLVTTRTEDWLPCSLLLPLPANE